MAPACNDIVAGKCWFDGRSCFSGAGPLSHGPDDADGQCPGPWANAHGHGRRAPVERHAAAGAGLRRWPRGRLRLEGRQRECLADGLAEASGAGCRPDAGDRGCQLRALARGRLRPGARLVAEFLFALLGGPALAAFGDAAGIAAPIGGRQAVRRRQCGLELQGRLKYQQFPAVVLVVAVGPTSVTSTTQRAGQRHGCAQRRVDVRSQEGL
mmetsp:Transcript_12312/g.31831  ORF Transcript_12312/g.31831 Transcript_12312/m.31831 type:complete len:211 (+) Transcript_12312:795-1427(+)